LSFNEWLLFTGADYLIPELEQIRLQKDYISSAHRELTDHFDEYLVYGGYPEVTLEKDKDERFYC
jgi:predicted AAA+ superfamily ATPase